MEILEARRVLDGLAVVGGTAFEDLDRDGLRDADDPGLAGWTVELERVGTSDTPVAIFANPTPDEWSQFGRFVSAAGDHVVVGSHYDDVTGFADAGAAYLFDSATGRLLHTLQSPDPHEGDKFGRAVAGFANRSLVGAPLDDTVAWDGGAVYMFDNETGQLLHVFLSPTGGANDQFGRAVATVGDKVLVGARFDDTAAEDAGAAFLFDSQTGDLLQTYRSPNRAENAQFGYAVSAMGDNVLIGARYDETGAAGMGAVYLFDGQSGNLLQSFPNPTQRGNGDATGFGRSVAAVGEDVLVGARRDDSGVDGAGAAFLFDGATGELLHTFTSPTPFEGEEFGFHVAPLEKDVLIGARWDNRWDGLAENSGGAAYLFDGVTGQLMQTFVNPSPGAWDAFGISVGSLGDSVIVGTQAGNAVYLFDAFADSTVVSTGADGSYRFTSLDPGTYRVLTGGRDDFVQTRPRDTIAYTVAVGIDESHLAYDFGETRNEPPAGHPDSYTVREDDILHVSASEGLLSNDTDPDADPLTAHIVNQPPYGALMLSPDGALSYRPDADFAGSDSFTYRADDGLAPSNLKTVTVHVTPVNDAPKAVDNGMWLLINTPRTAEAPGVLADDVDADDDLLTATLVDPPSHGTVTLEANGAYTFTPQADYAGPDRFTYVASDGTVQSNLATVFINVSVSAPDSWADHLRVTELNYHPYPPTSRERELGFVDRELFEFIEMTNTGPTPLSLAGVRFTGAVEVDFLQDAWLEANERGLLVKDRAAFETRYGPAHEILGQYGGDLSNSGERLTIKDPFDRTVLDFAYDDGGDWPLWADGYGSSLEVLDANGDYSFADNWRNSSRYGGSPGTVETGPIRTVVINEVLTHANLPQTDAIELHNTTNEDVDIGGWYLSDSANDFKEFRIPDETVVPAGSYLVFDEHDFNSERWNPGAGGFAFDSALGDDLWLTEADADGSLTFFVDHVEFGAALNGQSFGRWPNGAGDMFPMHTLTLEAENASPRIGPIVISEVMYNPPAPGGGISSRDLEFIEIYNPTTAALDLRNWQIRGGISYDFPNSKYPTPVDFSPGETILIVPFNTAVDSATVTAFREYHGITDPVQLFGPFVGRLDDDSDTVRLMRADAPAWWEPDIIPRVLEDELTYDDDGWPASADGEGDSLYRRGVDQWGLLPSSWAAAAPSPGSVDLQAGHLAITEINFHPHAPTATELQLNPELTAGHFEFIELLNISGQVVDLSGMQLTHGVGFRFPDRSLATGQRVVIVGDRTAFQTRYGAGVDVIGEFS